MNYFVWILNAKIVLRGKDYGCGKSLWADTRKESFMFRLRNWSYLITSSSSGTLLLDILIFHSDVSQSLFCFKICCIQHAFSNFAGWWYYRIIYSTLALNFFQLQNGKKIPLQGKEIIVFSRCACAKSNLSLSAEKFPKWTLAFIARKEKIVNSWE